MPNNIHLQVADPCHENWNTMTVSEQGRYCQSCCKTVTDFSMMTDKEILNHLSKRDVDVCGRFTSEQLNRTLIGEHKKKFSWAYVWNFVIATFLTVNYTSAQQTTGRPAKVTASNKVIVAKRGAAEGEFSFVIPDGIKKIEGVILESKTNLPVPFASVVVKGTTNGATTDINGKFTLSVFFASKELTLEVSGIGFTTSFLTVSKTTNGLVSFYLEPQPIDLNASIVGMIIQKETVPASKKIKRRMDDWTTGLNRIKEMTVYPNPLAAGGEVNISISVKLTGDYVLEILDEEGRVMHRKQVTINSKTQIISISTHPSWAKGVYWVRATGSESRKVVHSKLLIQ